MRRWFVCGFAIIPLVLINLNKALLLIQELSASVETTEVTDHVIVPRHIDGDIAVSINSKNRSQVPFIKDHMSHVIEPIAFQSWPSDVPLPCLLPDDNWNQISRQAQKRKRGLFFAKLYKTGSSTGAGIHLRISRNIAIRQQMTFPNGTIAPICRAKFFHIANNPGLRLYNKRDKSGSILWTTIREPTRRAISAFFHFGVSRRQLDPQNVHSFINFSDKVSHVKDYYLRALYTDHNFKREEDDPVNVSNDILQSYNFIAIAERMDESAVVLMMLLNLRLADILYLSAKTSGAYDDGKFQNQCFFIQPSILSSKMKAYIESEEWATLIRYDVAFYQAVNQSLELTIDRLGRDAYQENLQKFLYAKQYAVDKCIPDTVFPCDNNGIYHPPNETDCLWGDSGCGTRCLDEVATELNMWGKTNNQKIL